MSLGLFFDGMSDTKDFLQLANEAESLGIDSIWLAEHFCYRDAFVMATAVLQATKKMQVVPGPLSPYAHHPMTLAMGIATLAELGQGRVGLHLGTGNVSAQKEIGIQVTRPVETLRESIETIRCLLGGEFVYYPGKHFTFEGAKMALTAQVPIYLAAIGPKMLATAGECADGVVLSGGLSAKFISKSLKFVNVTPSESRRAGNSFQKAGIIIASVAPTHREAYDTVKPLLSYLFRTPFLSEDWALNGLHVDHEAILVAIQHRDWETAQKYVSDDAIVLHSIAGSPEEFKKCLRGYLDSGLDLPVLWLVGSPERQKLALETALEV